MSHQYPDPDHRHQSWPWSKTYFVEMGSDMLLLFAWQVSTVPRSSLCNGPTWAKNLNIVLLLSSRLIYLIARKNLTKAKQFYYGRVVEIKLKSLDLAGTSLVFCQRVNYCNSLFWEDFANVREVVSSMNSQLKQFDFQESEKQTGKVVKIYVWQKLKRFWKTGILMRWRGRMKNDVVASQSFPKCKI